jgi:hypothetical protein
MRLISVVVLVAFCAFGLLAVQGCGGEGKVATDQGEVEPRTNVTIGDSTSRDAVKTDKADKTDKTTAPVKTQPSQPDTSDSDAAVNAAKADATDHNPSIGSLDVLGVEVVGSWARVDLEPSNKSTDGASWLLKKSNGAWTVVEYGTSILPSDHPEAPAELFR